MDQVLGHAVVPGRPEILGQPFIKPSWDIVSTCCPMSQNMSNFVEQHAFEGIIRIVGHSIGEEYNRGRLSYGISDDPHWDCLREVRCVGCKDYTNGWSGLLKSSWSCEEPLSALSEVNLR